MYMNILVCVTDYYNTDNSDIVWFSFSEICHLKEQWYSNNIDLKPYSNM